MHGFFDSSTFYNDMIIIDSFSVDPNTYGMDLAKSADSSFEQDDDYIS